MLLIAVGLLVILYWVCQLRFLLLVWIDCRLTEVPQDRHNISNWPEITIQLPVYREHKVLRRLLDAVIDLDAPRDAVRVQVLDDSTGTEAAETRSVVEEFEARGAQVAYINRGTRHGFKAGALNHGLTLTTSELIAFFDADCLPGSAFLAHLVPYFADPRVAAVQARWDYPEALHSPLTQMQGAIFEWLFRFEISPRAKLGMPVFYMGTAAIWRREAITELGGWKEEPLTCEDLDLAYRAALAGWKILYHPEVLASNTAIEDLLVFRAQQRRWARSLLQVGYDNFPAIARARLPLWAKLLEFSMLMTHSMPSVLLAAALVSALAVVSGVERTTNWIAFQLAFAAAVLLSPGMITLVLVQRSFHADWQRRAWYLMRALPDSVGMAVSFVFGLLDFVFRPRAEFTATPKGGEVGVVEGSRQKWLSRHTGPLIFEGVIGTITAGAAIIAVFRYPEACIGLAVVSSAILISFSRTVLALRSHAARLRSQKRSPA
jgi:cellulose synthase/poly-beta-1,6-N-acetylglucosamine synthase-like glycosyltransferase